MHVIQLFQPLLFTPHIQVIKAPLPDARGAMQVHRGRQGEGGQHSPAPGQLAAGLEVFENESGRSLFEALNNSGRVGLLRGQDQSVEVFGHQNLADDLETELGSQSGESGDEVPAKTVGIKQPGPAVCAGSDKMQVVQPAQSPAHMAQYAMYAPPAFQLPRLGSVLPGLSAPSLALLR